MTVQSKPMEKEDASHMNLVSGTDYICERCGDEYDLNQEAENPSFYWVPSCPNCGAKMTCNPVTQSWLEIVGSRLESSGENYEAGREKLHAHARLFHGRLIGYNVDELVRRAKWFDRQAETGTAYGPRFHRDVAFQLRKQAREQV